PGIGAGLSSARRILSHPKVCACPYLRMLETSFHQTHITARLWRRVPPQPGGATAFNITGMDMNPRHDRTATRGASPSLPPSPENARDAQTAPVTLLVSS